MWGDHFATIHQKHPRNKIKNYFKVAIFQKEALYLAGDKQKKSISLDFFFNFWIFLPRAAAGARAV